MPCECDTFAIDFEKGGLGDINEFLDDSCRNTQRLAKIAKRIAVWKDAFVVPCVCDTLQRALSYGKKRFWSALCVCDTFA